MQKYVVSILSQTHNQFLQVLRVYKPRCLRCYGSVEYREPEERYTGQGEYHSVIWAKIKEISF
jgi:hypothetical protein